MEQGTIRNIIFDLGGVIMDIDPARTFNEFASLCKKPLPEIIEFYNNSLFFRRYEAGIMSNPDFRDKLRTTLKVNSTDHEINFAWNAMLVGIPPAKLEMISAAAKKFRTFLLSNTNAIHRRRFEKLFKDISHGKSIHEFFETVYYSYELNLRKPDPAIFRMVLDNNQLKPDETLLVDDNLDNIESARSLNMKVLHVSMNQPEIKIPGL